MKRGDLAHCPAPQETDACISLPTWMDFYIAVLPVAMVRMRPVFCVCSLADVRLPQQRRSCSIRPFDNWLSG